MIFHALFLLFLLRENSSIIKDIKSIGFKDYVRISLELKEKVDFNFSADKKTISILFSREVSSKKKIMQINDIRKSQITTSTFLAELQKNKIEIKFKNNFSVARYFVIPFPYKIIIDVGFKEKDIEDFMKENERKPRIVIDAGHGGKDPGTISAGTKEKDITLLVAKKLYEEMKKTGKFDVFLTRDKDVFLELEERSAIANALECDAFISIHVNSSKSQAKGFEIYYFSQKFSEYAFKIAQKENGVKMGKDESIVFNISSDFREDSSKKLAKTIAGHINKLNIVRRIEGAPFYVLAGTFCPSVLVEIGFITNPEERKKLKDKNYISQLTEKIYIAVEEFINSYLYQNSYL